MNGSISGKREQIRLSQFGGTTNRLNKHNPYPPRCPSHVHLNLRYWALLVGGGAEELHSNKLECVIAITGTTPKIEFSLWIE